MSGSVTTPAPVIAGPGRTFLPGGIVIAWGIQHLNAGANILVPFTPNFTAFFSVVTQIITAGGSAPTAGVANPGVAGFTLFNNDVNNRDICWMAIGVG